MKRIARWRVIILLALGAPAVASLAVAVLVEKQEWGGLLMDGIIGRGRRVEYTIIGDAVNTASRVEEYTKEVLVLHTEREGDDAGPGATILISQATYEQVKDQVRVDSDILPLQAEGKAEPIQVCRVLEVLGMEV